MHVHCTLFICVHVCTKCTCAYVYMCLSVYMYMCLYCEQNKMLGRPMVCAMDKHGNRIPWGNGNCCYRKGLEDWHRS